MMRPTSLLGWVAIATALHLGGSARAAFVLNVTESGGDVVALGSGTLNVTDLSYQGQLSFFLQLDAANARAVLGSGAAVDIYGGVTGPTSFGPGKASGFNPDVSSGDIVGVWNGSLLLVPIGYTSGTSLQTSNVWTNQTFASMGINPGTYAWTWGSGADADSFTMVIGGSTAVPEPSGVVTLGAGALAFACRVRRRRTDVAG